MSIQELSEQEGIRRNSLHKMRELGIDPYPAAEYKINATSTEIKENFNEEKKNYQEVVLAGRIMSFRIMGKASFAELQDHTGRIQICLLYTSDAADERSSVDLGGRSIIKQQNK